MIIISTRSLWVTWAASYAQNDGARTSAQGRGIRSEWNRFIYCSLPSRGTHLHALAEEADGHGCVSHLFHQPTHHPAHHPAAHAVPAAVAPAHAAVPTPIAVPA